MLMIGIASGCAGNNGRTIRKVPTAIQNAAGAPVAIVGCSARLAQGPNGLQLQIIVHFANDSPHEIRGVKLYGRAVDAAGKPLTDYALLDPDGLPAKGNPHSQALGTWTFEHPSKNLGSVTCVPGIVVFSGDSRWLNGRLFQRR